MIKEDIATLKDAQLTADALAKCDCASIEIRKNAIQTSLAIAKLLMYLEHGYNYEKEENATF